MLQLWELRFVSGSNGEIGMLGLHEAFTSLLKLPANSKVLALERIAGIGSRVWQLRQISHLIRVIKSH